MKFTPEHEALHFALHSALFASAAQNASHLPSQRPWH